MLKIGICDDEEMYIDQIFGQISQRMNQTNTEVKIETYQNSEFLLFDIREGIYFDILFLDVEMPRVSGLELADEIRKLLPHTLIIFITSYLDYALNGYELSVFRFVMKSNLETQLNNALNDAVKYLSLKQNQKYTIMTSNHYDRINYSDIVYIYKNGKNAVLVTVTGEEKSVRKSLKVVFHELDCSYFIFIDRGYIVNLMHVKSIEGSSSVMDDGSFLPISRSHVKDTKEAIGKYWSSIL